MAKVELCNVTKIIRKRTIIDHVSLSFPVGQVSGLRGVNGSGKTMLMRLVAGLILPTEGKVFIDGKQLHRELSFPPSIGALIENPAFLDGYSGKDNLKLLADIQGKISEREIDEILKTVGLADAGKKKYKRYSLGMKQRLGIAAAVMEQPEIVLLDEPTNALDSEGVEMVQQLVKREKERGAAVIIACHEWETLKLLSDVIHVVENGRITESIQREDFS